MRSEFLPGGMELQTPSAEQIAGVGQPFLRFGLVANTTALLPVHQMTETLAIATNEIVPIPNMPAWVMGIHNWRGEILWIVDLGHLVGLEPLYQYATNRPTYTAIVIHEAPQMPGRQPAARQISDRKVLGLVVNQVEDMEWCNPDLIQSPPASAVSLELVPFLRGYWLKSNSEILLVIDGKAILAAMP
jgi:positive phototaxis protein PixI